MGGGAIKRERGGPRQFLRGEKFGFSNRKNNFASFSGGARNLIDITVSPHV